MNKNRMALINKRFGKLSVISFSHIDTKRRTCWDCKCDCGNNKVISQNLLKTGKVKSCGCLRHTIGKESNKWEGFEEISLTKWNSFIISAKSRNINFNLSIEDGWNLFLKQERKCALTGISLFFPKWHGDIERANASLDRINSNEPYTKNNVQWVDKRINMMKQGLPEEEFIKLCKLVIINKNQ